MYSSFFFFTPSFSFWLNDFLVVVICKLGLAISFWFFVQLIFRFLLALVFVDFQMLRSSKIMDKPW